MKLLGLTLLASLTFAAACGSKSPAPAAPTGGNAAAEGGDDVAVPADLAFDDMNQDQKKSFMRHTVMPAMKAKFQAFDGTKYAEFGCKTCHGAGAEDGSYEMPNGDLPKLDFANMDKLDADKQKIAEFMGTEVKPTMAALLKQPEYTPENPKGFGCLECHTMVGQ